MTTHLLVSIGGKSPLFIAGPTIDENEVTVHDILLSQGLELESPMLVRIKKSGQQAQKDQTHADPHVHKFILKCVTSNDCELKDALTLEHFTHLLHI